MDGELTISMLERVARALCKADGTDPDADWSEWKPNLTDPPRLPAWKEHTGAARAALEAIRIPSPDMISAGANTPGMTAVNVLVSNTYARTGHDALAGHDPVPMSQAWTAMIDAILSEGGHG